MNDKQKLYRQITAQFNALFEDETNLLIILSNTASLLYHELEDVSWAGFYLYDRKKDELFLGPFQGKPACMHIPNGKGVCGTCLHEKKAQCVKDVHQFPGHIACDSASNSEIVLPIMKGDQVFAVLDLDSVSFSRFDADDEEGLSILCALISDCITVKTDTSDCIGFMCGK